MFQVVEKKNPLHVHALCSTRADAQRWIDVKAPDYCARGFFSDKTLTPDSFAISERPLSAPSRKRGR